RNAAVRRPRNPADQQKTRDSRPYDSSSRWHESSGDRPGSKSPEKTSTNDGWRQSAVNRTEKDRDPTRKTCLQRPAASRTNRNHPEALLLADSPATMHLCAECCRIRPWPSRPHLPPSVHLSKRIA